MFLYNYSFFGKFKFYLIRKNFSSGNYLLPLFITLKYKIFYIFTIKFDTS